MSVRVNFLFFGGPRLNRIWPADRMPDIQRISCSNLAGTYVRLGELSLHSFV